MEGEKGWGGRPRAPTSFQVGVRQHHNRTSYQCAEITGEAVRDSREELLIGSKTTSEKTCMK